MLYFVSENRYPLRHILSGKLVDRDGFLHNKRTLDTFVLLVGCQGTLYIAQDNREFELHPNGFVILFPGHTHYGYRPSEGEVSYYWCHFQITHNRYEILHEDEFPHRYPHKANSEIPSSLSDIYLLPECGEITSGERTSLVFRQLLDLANKSSYSKYLPNYALSLLAMEISQESIEKVLASPTTIRKSHYHVAEITQWIKVNYDNSLSVQKIAEHFGYNPDYLSSLFKQHTGLSLIQFINHTKIAVAKQLLLESSASIKEITTRAGFGSEKHFMKLFKQYEDVTPTQYRQAFFRQNLNKQDL